MNKTRQNYLIVIAIDEYQSVNWPDLKNAVQDAKDVTELLISRYDFQLLDKPLFNQEATRENSSST